MLKGTFWGARFSEISICVDTSPTLGVQRGRQVGWIFTADRCGLRLGDVDHGSHDLPDTGMNGAG